MSSAWGRKFWKLLAFRLTVLYGGVLVASALLCFLISYFLVASAMQDRTDADLLREANHCADSFREGDFTALKKQIDADARATGTNDEFFVLSDASGKRKLSSDLSSWSDMIPTKAAMPEGSSRFDNATGSGHHERVRVLTYRLDSDDLLQIGFSVQDDWRVIDQVRRISGVLMLGLVGVAVVVGWIMAKRALAGVQQVTSTANEITR
jgi:hypothetical protein